MIIGGVDSDGETLKKTHVYDFDPNGHHDWTTGNSFLLLQDFPIMYFILLQPVLIFSSF